MFQPLHVAATGLDALQDKILAITNNISNTETVAFKKNRTDLESLPYIQKSFKYTLNKILYGVENPGIDVEYGSGVKVAATQQDFTPGTIETTTRPLDLAVEGEGFFQFMLADGTVAYGRAGNLHTDADGNLVDPNGYKIQPEIVIPQQTTAILIQADGTVWTAQNNSTTYNQVGQLTLARFNNPQGLQSLGQNMYQATEASGEAVIDYPGEPGCGNIRQYALERSNVNLISEMMSMVMTQKVFDSITKAVQSYENMLTSLDKMKQA